MNNNTQNTWNRQQLHASIHWFSSSNPRRRFCQLIWSSTVSLGKTDHSKNSAPYRKTSPASWKNWIQRQPHSTAGCLCSISHKACDFTQVLEFLTVICYSTYFHMQIHPIFPVEMPCTKLVLPLWKPGGFCWVCFLLNNRILQIDCRLNTIF